MSTLPYTFDDEYTGPRWRFGAIYRRVTFFTAPNDFIVGSGRPHPEFRFGTVDYPRQLSDEEAAAYQLTLVGRYEEAPHL